LLGRGVDRTPYHTQGDSTMRHMQGDEWKHFVSEAPRTAIAGVTRADGRPHCSPVWIDLDGDEIVFTTDHDSVKARAIRRDGRISLCVDDKNPPFSYVTIDGTATLHDDPQQLRYWAARIGGRYMGADRAEEYGARNGAPGELFVRVRVTHVVGYRDVAD